MENHTLLLIDGFNLLSRAFFATSYGRTDEQLRNNNGVYTNALRVFFQKLFNLISEHNVTHLGIAWDVKREETQRRIKYDFYKSTRSELPEALIQQYETCCAFLESIGVKQIVIPPYEADDVLGTLAKRWSQGKCLIYSNDRDLFQLLSETTSQIIATKQGEFIYTLADFHNDYGITSKQWIDVKALLGDSSDNIPGCPGVGEKSALPLIQQYGSLERLYEQVEQLDPKFNRYKKKLIEGKGTAFISKELSEIICNIKELQELVLDEFTVNISEENLQAMLEELRINLKIGSFGNVG
jgi:5'-3' exonuclease